MQMPGLSHADRKRYQNLTRLAEFVAAMTHQATRTTPQPRNASSESSMACIHFVWCGGATVPVNVEGYERSR